MSSCFNCDAFRANFELILFPSLWFYLTCVFLFNYVVFSANFNILFAQFFLILFNLCVLLSIMYSKPILNGHDGVDYFAHPLHMF